MGGNDGKSGASQTDIDAKLYKVLLDLEIRLDSKFEKSRQQNKEDTQNIVELAVSRSIQPVLSEISGINAQLREGNKRFDEQSNRIKRANDVAVQAASDALVAKTERSLPLQAAEDEKPKEGWISASTLVAFLPALGSLIATVLASVALMRSPAQPDPQATPATPATSAAPPAPHPAPTTP